MPIKSYVDGPSNILLIIYIYIFRLSCHSTFWFDWIGLYGRKKKVIEKMMIGGVPTQDNTKFVQVAKRVELIEWNHQK